MTEETYDHRLAGLSHSIVIEPNGFSLKVWGYDEKQPLLVKTLVRRLATFEPGENHDKVMAFDHFLTGSTHRYHSKPKLRIIT